MKLLALICLLSFNTFAQSIPEIDSILSKIDASDTTKENADKLNDIIFQCKKIEYQKGEANTLHKLGWLYEQKQNFQLSFKHYQQSIVIRKQTGETDKMAFSLVNVAYLYHRVEEYDKEIKAAMEVIKVSNNDSLRSRAYSCMGSAYIAKGDAKNGMVFFKIAIKIKESSELNSDIYLDYNSIGCAYLRSKNYDSALYYFGCMQGYSYNRSKVLAKMHNNIGVAYHLKKEFPQAKVNYLRSIQLQDKDESGKACLNYAELLFQNGFKEEAERYLRDAMDYNYDIAHLGRTLVAMHKFEQAIIVKDCLIRHANKNFDILRTDGVKMAEIETSVLTEREREALKEANEWKEKMLWTGFCVGVITVVFVGIYIWNCRYKIRDYQKSFKDIRLLINKSKDI